jgi:hypothetical protein
MGQASQERCSPNNDYGNRDKYGSSVQSERRRRMCSRGTARGNTLDAQTRKHETFSRDRNIGPEGTSLISD